MNDNDLVRVTYHPPEGESFEYKLRPVAIILTEDPFHGTFRGGMAALHGYDCGGRLTSVPLQDCNHEDVLRAVKAALEPKAQTT